MTGLKVGDWVLTEDRVRRIRAVYNGHIFFLGFQDFVFAHDCTPLPKELYPLLSDSKLGEDYE